jgi:putative membrane protein
MKQRWTLILGIVLLASLLSCKKNEDQNTATTDTSTTTAATDTSTTTTSATDTGATSGTSGTTATTGSTTSTLDKDDQEFLTKAAEGGIAEVNLGQLAASKATSDDVKTFGNQMVSDHGKANDELKNLAQQKNVVLPTGPGKEGEDANGKLSGKSGKDFDKAYMDDMVKDHEKDIKEFEKASKNAKDPDVKTWATNTLPTLKHHLDMAKATQKKIK